MLIRSIIIAFKAHKGQKDLNGNPVFLHPLYVALKGKNKKEFIVGILHDVVEDSDYTFEDLLKQGISEEIVNILKILTHEKGKNYDDYINNIINSKNEIAIHVKMNDLKNNLNRNQNKFPKIFDKHIKAYNKFKKENY